ncbi:glycoside hydrolase family protein [Vulcanococcus sp.]|uniref:glycoside hydrolase family protein n=1 Tax=Vulcanococcus sp. TaxID=2856995 RepID=UPI003F6A19D2
MSPSFAMTIDQVQFNDQRWLQFWDHYKGLEHQMQAIVKLGQHIKEADPGLLCESSDWVDAWRNAPLSTDYAPALKLIKDFEGCHLSAYPDPLSGGDPWTIGYGTTRYFDGRKVQRGDQITVVDADELLRGEVGSIAIKLRSTVPHWSEMNQGQRCSLISFAYNLGPSFMGAGGFETISRCLRDRLWDQVPAALQLYRNPGTNVEAGLLRRRKAEGQLWRGSQIDAPKKATVLTVKWQSQLDNKSGTGYRECFSSSCAMLAMFWGKVVNDDAYNAIRAKYGDTTSAEAQLAALRSLGLKADFHTNGRPDALEREISAGRPVAVGWLHQGPTSAPRGGGHWSVVIGYTDVAWIQNDPNGEALLVQGGYAKSTKGAGMVYSRKNWDPRWMPSGSGGWYLTCRP